MGTDRPAPPDPTHVPNAEEIAGLLRGRGIQATLNSRGHVELVGDEAAVKVLRLSEQLLTGYGPGDTMQVEMRHLFPDGSDSIWQLGIARSREQAWEWMKGMASTPSFDPDDWFVIDDGPAPDRTRFGPRLRSKYAVVDGQVISLGWEESTGTALEQRSGS